MYSSVYAWFLLYGIQRMYSSVFVMWISPEILTDPIRKSEAVHSVWQLCWSSSNIEKIHFFYLSVYYFVSGKTFRIYGAFIAFDFSSSGLKLLSLEKVDKVIFWQSYNWDNFGFTVQVFGKKIFGKVKLNVAFFIFPKIQNVSLLFSLMIDFRIGR